MIVFLACLHCRTCTRASAADLLVRIHVVHRNSKVRLDTHLSPSLQSIRPAMTAQQSLKDQGNEEFHVGNFLKAAALYSKALKEDPGNAVLFRCCLYIPA